jgi:hypothetical protein
MKEIKMLEKKPTGSMNSQCIRYVSELNQVCRLDSLYEYDYALYLDFLYENKKIQGWFKNTCKFTFATPLEYEVNGKKYSQNSYIPDFIIFDDKGKYSIVEIKGWVNCKAKAIIEKVKTDPVFKDLNISFKFKEDIKALQSTYADKIIQWVKVH